MPPIISEDQAASEASTEHTDAASGSSSGAAAEPTGQENHSGTAAAPAPGNDTHWLLQLRTDCCLLVFVRNNETSPASPFLQPHTHIERGT